MRGFGFARRQPAAAGACSWSAITLATGLSWFALMDLTGRVAMRVAAWHGAQDAHARTARRARRARRTRREVRKADSVQPGRREPVRIETPAAGDREERTRGARKPDSAVHRCRRRRRTAAAVAARRSPSRRSARVIRTRRSRCCRARWSSSSRTSASRPTCVGVYPGPVITRFELRAGAGRARQPDLQPRQGHRARPVGGQRARGRRDSGQERDRPGDPQHAAQIVYLSEILRSEKYDALKSPLALALGKDIGGRAGGGRSGQDAASAGRRHHRLGQVGGASTRWC